MKWHWTDEGYSKRSTEGYRAVKITTHPVGFEWCLFYPGRPEGTTKHPDKVCQTLKELYKAASDHAEKLPLDKQ